MYTQYLPTFPVEMLVTMFHNALHLLCIVFIMSCPPGNELETHLGRGRMFVPTKVITIHMFILFCSSSSLALTAWYMFSGGSFNPSVGTTGHPVRPTENGRRSSLRSHNTSVLVDQWMVVSIEAFSRKNMYILLPRDPWDWYIYLHLVGGWTNPFEKYARRIGSWKLTCNLTMEVWKMMLLFKQDIFRFHVGLRGCISRSHNIHGTGIFPVRIHIWYKNQPFITFGVWKLRD